MSRVTIYSLEVKWSESRSLVSDSLWPCGRNRPWNSPGQNIGVGSLSLLQGIFPTQGSTPGLLHYRWILYQLSHKGSPIQPKDTPFPVLNQSIVPCPVLTVASWSAYRFLRRLVRWSGIPISLTIFHIFLWSTQSKALAQSVKQMFFWNSLAFFLWSSGCWQFDLWYLCLF